MNIWQVKQSTVVWIALALGAFIFVNGFRYDIAQYILSH